MKDLLNLFLPLTLATLVLGKEQRVVDAPVFQEWLKDQRDHQPVVDQSTDPLVTIKNGTVKGTTYYAVGGDVIYAYLGIPYAEAPTGQNRFKPPQVYNGWGSDVTYDASKHPASCPQWLTNTTVSSEDCLFVSVYTKRSPGSSGEPLPVMYWIHGGGFLLGGTSYYTASKLLANDVVYVSVQYRLGPLGFLSTGDDVVTGNMGMKDMVQGLQWVQENIEAFGGDPNKVTVFGESAGGAASTFMLISPLAQGLFNKVASLSGTAIAEWSMDRNPIEFTQKLAKSLNCPDTVNSQAIVDCLRTKDYMDIASHHFELLLTFLGTELQAVLPGTSPVVEPLNTPGAFLTEEPLKLFQSGPVAQVPVLMGTTQHEGSFLLGAAHFLSLGPSGVLDDPVYVHESLVTDLLATWRVDETTNGGSVSQALAAGFLPQGTRTNFTLITYELIDMLSVLFMKAPVLRTAEILSRRVPSVHFYSFEHVSRNSLWKLAFPLIVELLGGEMPPFEGGITHADDLMHMFSLPFIPSVPDIAFSKIYCKLFTNFAIFGNPAPVATAEYPVWPTFTVQEPKYMVLNATPNVQNDYTQSWKKGLNFNQ